MQWAEFQFHIGHLSESDQLAVKRAFELGAKAHAKQKRISGEPYFSHPIAVAHILADLGADRDTIVAGLLHDTIEDTPLSLAEIESEFGRTVATLIDGVTKLEHVDVAGKPGLNEKIETLRKMFTLMQQDVRIMVIKLADRLHNMQTIGFRPMEKQIEVARETMDVYVKIADRLCMRDMQSDLESLSLAVLEPDLHARLLELRTELEHKGQDVMRNVIERLGKNQPVTRGVEARYEHKSWLKLRELLKSEGHNVTGVANVILSFECTDIGACYQVLGALHQEWQRETLSFQDFINSPMINGYRALHTTVILEDGTRVRCKIRTEEMERYAHRGITIFCFQNKGKGLFDELPWTRHIAAIATDTSERSEEFWQGLQSDILGSTIVAHGPDDRTVLLPMDATVLDGAFYLFNETALRMTDIRMNGRPVAFNDPLENAATLSATFGNESRANLQWLRSVHTGVASAIIRKQLAAAPRAQKIDLGKELLDIALQRLLHLRLDEISSSLFQSRLHRLGLATPEEVFVDIGEGKLQPADVTMQLFADFRKQNGHGASSWVLRARVSTALEQRFLHVVRSFPTNRVSTKHDDGHTNITIRLTLNQQQADELETSLTDLLPTRTWSLQHSTSMRVFIGAITILLLLWGLDPVIARSLLTSGMSPYDLTFIRAATFFVASAALYGGQLATVGRRLQWLSPLHPTLALSGAALFATALLSYVTLSGLPATTYILCIIGGLLGTTLFRELAHARAWRQSAISLLLIVLTIVVAGYTLGFTDFSILAGVGSALGFALYSELSRRYQVEGAAIRARYPAFLFWMSVVCLLFAFTIYPFTTLEEVGPLHLAQAVCFVLVFSVLPYSLYFELTRRIESALIDRSLPLVAVITVVGELVLSNSIAPLISLPLLLLFLTHYYGMYRRTSITTVAS